MGICTNKGISVSKRSRAARRGLIEEAAGEVKDLENVPKVNDDVKSSIIRTTIKNENLLNKKMEKKQLSKINKKKNNALKFKKDRSEKVAGILGEKIEQSISRAKYVQNSRKSGWDQINKSIKIRQSTYTSTEEGPSTDDIEKAEEDAYVAEFFGEDNKVSSNKAKIQQNANAFSLLEEKEA